MENQGRNISCATCVRNASETKAGDAVCGTKWNQGRIQAICLSFLAGRWLWNPVEPRPEPSHLPFILCSTLAAEPNGTKAGTKPFAFHFGHFMCSAPLSSLILFKRWGNWNQKPIVVRLDLQNFREGRVQHTWMENRVSFVYGLRAKSELGAFRFLGPSIREPELPLALLRSQG